MLISWYIGDVIGFLLEIEAKKISFFINGVLVKPIHKEIFQKVK